MEDSSFSRGGHLLDWELWVWIGVAVGGAWLDALLNGFVRFERRLLSKDSMFGT